MYPPAIGGVETHVERVSKYLKRDGHDVEVFCSDYTSLNRKSRAKLGRQTVDGIRVTRLKGKYLPGYGQKIAFPGLFSALMKADVDLIHVHSFPSLHFDISWMVAKMRGIPIVATGHFDPVLLDEAASRRHKRIYWHAWLKHALKRCSLIAIIGEEKRRYVENFGVPSKRISVIPNGVDLEELKSFTNKDVEKFIKRYGLKGKKVVLFVGRICRFKGIDILIRAIKPLLEKDKNIALLIVGPVDDRAYFEEIRRMTKLPNVIITGPLDRKDVLAAYKTSSVLVFPTRGEVFGITLVEGMMFKKIVIGTRVGGVPDIIDDGKNGFMFRLGDVDDLRKKIEYALKNYEKLGKVRENAYRTAVDKFSWEKIARKIEQVYKSELR